MRCQVGVGKGEESEEKKKLEMQPETIRLQTLNRNPTKD